MIKVLCQVKYRTGAKGRCVSVGGVEHSSHQVLMNILCLISDLFSSIKIKKLKLVLARISLIVHIVISAPFVSFSFIHVSDFTTVEVKQFLLD